MNTRNADKKIERIKPRDLPEHYLARGQILFSTDEAAQLMGVPKDHVRQRLAPLRRRGTIVAAGRGLWLAVPADRHAWGAPEPMAYIDDLMSARLVDYLVGWLSAAALHGASHQAAQVFQVAVGRPLRDLTLGRSRIEFHARRQVNVLPSATVTLPSGRAKVANVDTTMLMLAADLDYAGGIDNAATGILELSQENDGWQASIAKTAELFPASAGRRCGWILERLGGKNVDWSCLSPLAEVCASRGGTTMLDPNLSVTGRLDKRWGIRMNREVEPDA